MCLLAEPYTFSHEISAFIYILIDVIIMMKMWVLVNLTSKVYDD